ncbi:MAG: PIN domain-containing protein [Sulfuricaulis sp.]|nr:PIN domain-containing protein [Sulfuricaulis sp.]
MRLIDSDVIIWNWRSQEAAATLLAAEPFAISAVTYMELVQGMRNARELKNLQADLALWQVTILPITKAISERAVRLVEEHFLAHHLQLADALIAATAIEHKLYVAT